MKTLQTLRFRVRCLYVITLLILPSLLQAGDDLEATLLDAARGGDATVISQLLDAGVDANVQTASGYTPFILATYHAHTAAATALLAGGANPCATDERGSNALMGVAFRGHEAMAEWLLEQTPCSVNHRNLNGQTALMIAALFGREAMIEQLVAHGADPALADASGNTASSLAQAQGLTRVVNKLRFLISG
ncbi:MAG: hypothetical protein CMP06_01570 [Xanthomonadales bacterium]|nr:hypothetical protein [Xanthomonadales bacterium]